LAGSLIEYGRIVAVRASVSYHRTPYLVGNFGDINIVVPVMQIGAIEVYQPSEQPAQWAYTTPPTPAPFSINQNNKLNASGRPGSIDSLGQAGGTGCVKVIIWTKNRLGV